MQCALPPRQDALRHRRQVVQNEQIRERRAVEDVRRGRERVVQPGDAPPIPQEDVVRYPRLSSELIIFVFIFAFDVGGR